MSRIVPFLWILISGIIYYHAYSQTPPSPDSIRVWMIEIGEKKIEEARPALQSQLQKYRDNSIVLNSSWNIAKELWNKKDSPYRNDPLFFAFTQDIQTSDSLGYSARSEAEFFYLMMEKNQIGNPAEDFHYTSLNREDGTLHSLPDNRYTLLFFYDPECSECLHTIKMMQQSQELNSAIEEEKLQILAIYPESSYIYPDPIPSSWISGYDTLFRIQEENLYDIPSTPSIYLLSPDKKILIRDASWSSVSPFIRNLSEKNGK